MRLEMVVGMQTGILTGQSTLEKVITALFSKCSFETKPKGFTIQDSGFHSDDHLESHLFGIGLHITPYYSISLHITPYYSISLHITPYHSISLHITPYHSILLHITPYHCISLHITPYHSILLHITPYHSISLHITPYYSILLHIAPYHSISLHISVSTANATPPKSIKSRTSKFLGTKKIKPKS